MPELRWSTDDISKNIYHLYNVHAKVILKYYLAKSGDIIMCNCTVDAYKVKTLLRLDHICSNKVAHNLN